MIQGPGPTPTPPSTPKGKAPPPVGPVGWAGCVWCWLVVRCWSMASKPAFNPK